MGLLSFGPKIACFIKNVLISKTRYASLAPSTWMFVPPSLVTLEFFSTKFSSHHLISDECCGCSNFVLPILPFKSGYLILSPNFAPKFYYSNFRVLTQVYANTMLVRVNH